MDAPKAHPCESGFGISVKHGRVPHGGKHPWHQLRDRVGQWVTVGCMWDRNLHNIRNRIYDILCKGPRPPVNSICLAGGCEP